MLSINTNLSSLIAQRSMKQSTNKLNQAIERMTTGAKINHAKDNAANYNIATNMTTKLGALQVAEDNALQGLEMINTTSETLSLIEDKLSRMRALSVQALNGSYGEKSLSAINSEAESLLNEITRLNDSATYNGIKLFNTGKKEVTNAGKELELNEQGFLQEVVRVDTSTMTKLSSVDPNATLAVGEYSISTPEELAQLKEMSDAGLLERGSTFCLSANIDMSGVNDWTGIGKINAFRGVFNGNGYTISNLTGTQGLFANVQRKTDSDRYSEIKNLRLENVKVNTTSSRAAALCGSTADTNFVNCSVLKGQVVSTSSAIGGILGDTFYANQKFCYYQGEVSGSNSVGGIVGGNNYSYSYNCMFEGSVKSNKSAGGIAGWGDVYNSKVVGTVVGVIEVGGISGSRFVEGSFFSGAVIGDSKVGGIVGATSQYASGPSNCIMEGEISGNVDVGLLVGNVSSGKTIKDCYYYSKKTGDLKIVGTIDTAILLNIQDLTIPCDYTLQIGSSGDNKTSTVSCTTYIDFGQLNSVLSSGIESTDSIEKIEELIKIAELKQVELGTVQNRLTSVLEEISTQYENLVSSRSTLQDADIAEVSSEYVRQQILQQASATLMATANQSPSIALQLI